MMSTCRLLSFCAPLKKQSLLAFHVIAGYSRNPEVMHMNTHSFRIAIISMTLLQLNWQGVACWNLPDSQSMTLTLLIYTHGFNSSALSFKAGLLRDHMARLGFAQHYACPELSHRPAQAMVQLEALIASQDPRCAAVPRHPWFFPTR